MLGFSFSPGCMSFWIIFRRWGDFSYKILHFVDKCMIFEGVNYPISLYFWLRLDEGLCEHYLPYVKDKVQLLTSDIDWSQIWHLSSFWQSWLRSAFSQKKEKLMNVENWGRYCSTCAQMQMFSGMKNRKCLEGLLLWVALFKSWHSSWPFIPINACTYAHVEHIHFSCLSAFHTYPLFS